MPFFNSASNVSRDTAERLEVESLEERQMLSAVDVFAAGATGEESFNLSINNEVVSSYVAGGDPETREFQTFRYEQDTPIDVRDIKIEFTNDGIGNDGKTDRNLFVDKIVVDGVIYETENLRTYSTNNVSMGSQGPGRYQTETLYVNGGFRYSEFGFTAQTRIRIDASGSTGQEIMQLRIDGEVVAEYQVTQDTDDYYFISGKKLSPDRIRIDFINDLYQPELEVDRNLQVKKLQLISIETGHRISSLPQSDSVFSTGTWLPADGVTNGFGRGNTLHTDGFFQFGSNGRTVDSVLAEFDLNYAGSNPELNSQFTYFDQSGREYLVGGSRSGGEDILVLRLLSDGMVDRSFGEDGLFAVRLDTIEFPATANTIGNWERTGELGPRPETQMATGNVRSARLAFDSSGNAVVVMNVTVDDSANFSRSIITKWVGTQVIQLDSNGDLDYSFSNDGQEIIEYVEGRTVAVTDVRFDGSGQVLVTGGKVSPRTVFQLGVTTGIADEDSILRLVESSSDSYFVDEAIS